MRIVTMMMVTMWSNILYFHFRRNLATKGFWGFAQNVILELKGHPLSIIWIIYFICWDIEEQVQVVLRAKQEIILLSFPFNSLNLSKMENPLNFTSSLLTPDLWLHFAQRPFPHSHRRIKVRQTLPNLPLINFLGHFNIKGCNIK